MKLSEDYTGEHIHDLGVGKDFLNSSPQKKLTINGKCSRLGNTKIKNFCSSKYTIKRVERQHEEWLNIFAIHIFNKRLVSRIQIYLNAYKLIRKSQRTQEKMGQNTLMDTL